MIRAALLCACLALVRPAWAETCHAYPWSDEPRAAAALADILAVAPTLSAPLEDRKPSLCLTGQPGLTHGSYDPEARIIELSDRLDDAQLTAVLIHEIRHLDQDWRGICLSPDLSMREHARAVFALEADALAVAMLIAWELAALDGGAAFDALAAFDGTSDVAVAFREAVSETGDLSLATSEAFSAWYASDERRERYYLSACESYLSDHERRKAFPGTLKFDAGILTSICRLPSGTPYPCAEPEAALPR